jgi:superfamily II DNA or RNA helicase
MGKTLISNLVIDALLERGVIGIDEKVLFLVQDRKLKHQLYEMAKTYGLAEQGYLFLLDSQQDLPPHMIRQHSALARFLFSTPQLLLNAVVGRVKRITQETLAKVKVVVIDEILDIFAQSYGTPRPRKETIAYIERKFGKGRTFKEIIHDLKHELESSETVTNGIDERQLENHVLREFSSRNYRLNKRFEPLLRFLDLLDPTSERMVIGMTALLSQDIKIDLLRQTFGGDQRVAEIHPVGDDFEDHKPAYQLRRIRVFDEWITTIDAQITQIKGSLLKTLNTAYKLLTGRDKIPIDRLLLFVTDLIAKDRLQKQLVKQLDGDEQRQAVIISSAHAYLQITVARQRLLESTFQSFHHYITHLTNRVLTNNPDFTSILQSTTERATQQITDEKQTRLIYWLKRLTQENQRVLVLCRFVDMTKHLRDLATQHGIPSTNVHGRMQGSQQHTQITKFKSGDVQVLFASERLIEKGTDLPEADVGIYYGTTVSLERYEQSLGRIRSTRHNIKSFYTISYNQTIEDEKSLKREAMFLELVGKEFTIE